MAVEYDIVVIGSTPEGVYAAITATHFRARVALVEQFTPQANWLHSSARHSKVLLQIGRTAKQLYRACQLGIYQEDGASKILVDFAIAKQWATSVISNLETHYSPNVLASLGVEIISGQGQFSRAPDLAFDVNGRQLKSRTYLIATGSCPAIPEIEGLRATGYLTSEMLNTLKKLPQNLVVIGGDPIGTELAQTFARLGSQVTMVCNSSHILPKEDSEAARLVQAQLEAEGVRILTQTAAMQVKLIEGKKWIQAGDQAIEADEILLAIGAQPQVESLNLAAVGVTLDLQGIQVNQKLQTANPRIYACGDVIGGYRFAHVGKYEAKIALKNVLFCPLFKVNYSGIPWAIFSDPELARVGLTEVQAKRRYGHKVSISQQYFKTIDKAQILGETTGFCKLVLADGKILGASLVGPNASELIHPIALAMRQKLQVKAIADLIPIWPSLSEINTQTAAAWHQQRLTRNINLQEVLESFFTMRRSWHR